MIYYRGFNISIETDVCAIDPREDPGLAHIVVFDKRFCQLQDSREKHMFSFEHFVEVFGRKLEGMKIFPLTFKNKNGTLEMTLKPTFMIEDVEYPGDKWNSEWNGLIYVVFDEAAQRGISSTEMHKIREQVCEELRQFQAYRNGDVYQYFVEDDYENILFENGNYFDVEEAIKDAKTDIDEMLDFQLEKQWKNVFESQEVYRE